MFLVGKLNYLSVVSRPDLSFAVSSLSQVLKNPSKEHWFLTEKVLRYPKGSFDLGRSFKSSNELKLVRFCDSDWGGDPNERRSFSGCCFKVSKFSSVICWSYRKQQTVALSSTEKECMSISLDAQECVDLLFLVQSSDLGGPVLLHGDNQEVIKLAQNPITHSRSKHIDIRHHFIGDLVERRIIKLQYLPTEDNIADILTKALASSNFNQFRCGLFRTVSLRGVLAINEAILTLKMTSSMQT